MNSNLEKIFRIQGFNHRARFGFNACRYYPCYQPEKWDVSFAAQQRAERARRASPDYNPMLELFQTIEKSGQPLTVIWRAA